MVCIWENGHLSKFFFQMVAGARGCGVYLLVHWFLTTAPSPDMYLFSYGTDHSRLILVMSSTELQFSSFSTILCC